MREEESHGGIGSRPFSGADDGDVRQGHRGRLLDLDANPPAGAILHVAGEADGSITTSETGRPSRRSGSYLDYRLRPALRMHGVQREPVVEVAPLHNVYAPEIFTIERMGLVSLPAHAAGAPL